ncbi:unnamed protein product [Adineta ricciae]|uniref:Uncharacterized protein n=1 Tax=Adineta ricciae TaxID=249248 RepID=A0A814R4J0_ADIRI|nr:unnamed protein product [Adineta ricciae]CAF1603046.1 unnamed protein product [Adineta ricciae]
MVGSNVGFVDLGNSFEILDPDYLISGQSLIYNMLQSDWIMQTNKEMFYNCPGYYGTVGSGRLGSSHFLTVSCKLRAGNGQELIGYFLCNSGRNPAARSLLESAKTVPELRRAVPEPTHISTDSVAGVIDLGAHD